jgi:site-specific DNA recombinase
MKIGIYCRVSTDRQKDNTSIDEQKRLGIEFCKKRKFDYEVYSDQVSGAVDGNLRDEFVKLERKLHSKELGGIWFYDWDRMIRDFSVGVYFRNLITDTNCKVFVLNDEKNIFSDEGSLEFGFKTLLSDYERRKIRNRMMSGRYAKWREGKGYSGQLGLGYKFLGDGEVGIKVEEAEIIKFIFKTFLYKSTKTYMSVYNRVVNEYGGGDNVKGIGNSGRIRSILKDAKYKGVTKITDSEGKEWEFNIGRIISDEDFNNAQEKILFITSQRKGKDKGFQLLKGYVYCGDCGSKMWKRRSGVSLERGGRGKGKYDFYGCSIPQRMRYKTNGVGDVGLYCESDSKNMNRISVQKLESIIWDVLFMVLENNKQIVNEYRKKYENDKGLREDMKGKLRYYEIELRKLEDSKSNMLDYLGRNVISEDDYKSYLKNKYNYNREIYLSKKRNIEVEIEKLKNVESIEGWRSLMVQQLHIDKQTTHLSKRREIIEKNISKIKIKKLGNEGFNYNIEILFKIEVENNIKYDVIKKNESYFCVINNSKYVSQNLYDTTTTFNYNVFVNFNLNYKVGYRILKIWVKIL